MGPGHKRIEYQMVSVQQLEDAAQGSTVQFDDLSGAKPVLFKVGGLKATDKVNLPSGLTVKAHAFTANAKSAIEAAGGKCIKIDKKSRELDAEGKVVEKVAMFTSTGVMDSDDGLWISDSDVDVPEIAMYAAVATRTAKVGKYKEPTPLGKKITDQKKAIVSEVHENLKNSLLVFGFPVSGYTVLQITKLRRSMPAGVKVQVVKNTLVRLAARGTGFESLDPLTMGPKAWVFVPESCFQEAIKVYVTFMKDAKKQETNPISGGAMEGEMLSETQIVALSELPTKKELIEKLARLIKGIPTKLAVSIKATPRKLARAIKLATVGDGAEGAEAEAAA